MKNHLKSYSTLEVFKLTLMQDTIFLHNMPLDTVTDPIYYYNLKCQRFP